MRLLGIDPGEKRIGLAISDPLGITAQGLAVIHYTTTEEVLEEIIRVCREYEVSRVVIGNPINMSGSKGAASEKAETFAGLLRDKLTIPVVMIDERLTSSSAEKVLISGGVSRKKRKAVKDKIAAVLILETYMALNKPTNREV
ncbi:MAG: Holliday junction resolvase RuvX [Bacillota bacterium]|nr:Holliday junction resolvase RuvX [Bacillota bacterium]